MLARLVATYGDDRFANISRSRVRTHLDSRRGGKDEHVGKAPRASGSRSQRVAPCAPVLVVVPWFRWGV